MINFRRPPRFRPTTRAKMRTVREWYVRENWRPCWDENRWAWHVDQFEDEPWNALDFMALRDVPYMDRRWLLSHAELWTESDYVVMANAVAHRVLESSDIDRTRTGSAWLCALDRTHRYLVRQSGFRASAPLSNVHHVWDAWMHFESYMMRRPQRPGDRREWAFMNVCRGVMNMQSMPHRLPSLIPLAHDRLTIERSANEWFSVFEAALLAYHVNDAVPDFF